MPVILSLGQLRPKTGVSPGNKMCCHDKNAGSLLICTSIKAGCLCFIHLTAQSFPFLGCVLCEAGTVSLRDVSPAMDKACEMADPQQVLVLGQSEVPN